MSAAVAMTADEAATQPVIQMIDVDHFYEGQLGWNHALDHLTLTIERNEFLCIRPEWLWQEHTPEDRRWSDASEQRRSAAQRQADQRTGP